MTFWTAFYDWHVRTDHEWDVALHMEALRGHVLSVQFAIVDRMSPVLNRLIRDLERMLPA